jgi:tetratricopeptide (TPR) repeat protein
MYTGVADRLDQGIEMGDYPREILDDYQREILEKALRFYERFALPQSRDPQVRLEAARAGLRVGYIRDRLGDVAAAEQACRQVIPVLQGLVSEHPAEPAYRQALADAHDELAWILHYERRWGESEGEVRLAAALWDALARERPEVAGHRLGLAGAHQHLGYMYSHHYRSGDAGSELRLALDLAERLVQENPGVARYQDTLATVLLHGCELLHRGDLAGYAAACERAVAIRETLARDHPEVMANQVNLGGALRALAQAYVHQRNIPLAEEPIRRSIAILEKAAVDRPRNVSVARQLGETYNVMTDVCLFRGDTPSAVSWAGRSIQVNRSLARRDPRNTFEGRDLLGIALAGRAENLMRLGRHAEALVDFEEILAVRQGDRASELFRAFHALTRARLGDRSYLVSLADELRETLKLGAGQEHCDYYRYYMTYYDAACVHAGLARPASPDGERALELLGKARATGEFRRMIRLDEVRREALLDSLRADPRFQLLMMDVAFPDDPFRP